MLRRSLAAGTLAAMAWGQALQKGKSAFEAGDYATAEKLFRQASANNPDCEIPFYLGLTRYRLKRPDAAIIAFEEAVRCNPRFAPAYVALGEAYAEKANEKEATAAYEKALSLAPENTAALKGAAILYLRTKSNDKAVTVLSRLVKLDASNASAHLDLGVAYFGTGDLAAAATQFGEALRLKPDSAQAMLGLGNVYLKTGEPERAVESLRKAIALSPNTFEPRFVLGSAYNALGRSQDALDALEAALRLGGNEPEIYYQLAHAYGKLGRGEDQRAALAHFSELRKKSDESLENGRKAQRLVTEARGLIDSGDLDKALPLMQQAHQLMPGDDTILFRMAGLYYDLRQYAAARDCAQEAIALAPSEWLYHFLLGLVDDHSGRADEAAENLSIAARLNPSAANVRNALGEALLHKGDTEQAIANFRIAVELDPATALYQANLKLAQAGAAR